MRYRTAAAFKAALLNRLRERSLKGGPPLATLKKMVAFDRFLARLVRGAPGMWTLKGGLALQWRMGVRARTTKDVDATLIGNLEEARSRLMHAPSLDLGDWFQFEVGRPRKEATGAPEAALRFSINCLLDGRSFDQFPFDVGASDPIGKNVQEVTGPSLLDFAEIAPATVPCYPLDSQIAEKLHAYTRQYSGGGSSRVKDLVDILLIASLGSLDSQSLIRAIGETFRARGTHPLPRDLPDPPGGWSSTYRKMVRQLNLGWPTLEEAAEAAARFLNPVLQGTATGKWDPGTWQWH